jgi:hypothetical protein
MIDLSSTRSKNSYTYLKLSFTQKLEAQKKLWRENLYKGDNINGKY